MSNSHIILPEIKQYFFQIQASEKLVIFPHKMAI
jgi:hypothetical protein